MNRREAERASHLAADGVNRADNGLRRFGLRIGDAVMCPRCDGGGYVVGRALSPVAGMDQVRLTEQPVKCPTCKGEGLDPDVHGRQG
jgi:hypothetical protein